MLNYQEKYFKYKKKYLKLTGGNRFELSGGTELDDIRKDIEKNKKDIQMIINYLLSSKTKSQPTNEKVTPPVNRGDFVIDNENLIYYVGNKEDGVQKGNKLIYNLIYQYEGREHWRLDKDIIPISATKLFNEYTYNIKIDEIDGIDKYTISATENTETLITTIKIGDEIKIIKDEKDILYSFDTIKVTNVDINTQEIFVSLFYNDIYKVYNIIKFINLFNEEQKKEKYINDTKKKILNCKNEEELKNIFNHDETINIIKNSYDKVKEKMKNQEYNLSIDIIENLYEEKPTIDPYRYFGILLTIQFTGDYFRYKKEDHNKYVISIKLNNTDPYEETVEIYKIDQYENITNKCEEIYNKFIEKLLKNILTKKKSTE